MISERLNIYEYEQYLMGNTLAFVASFNKNDSFSQKTKELGNIWRYAITKILGWTPYEAQKYLTPQIVKQLMLPWTPLQIPEKEKENIKDYTFVLQYAFPDVFHFTIKDEAISKWQQVAHQGKWANDFVKYEWPKNFYNGEDGIERSSAMLMHVKNLYLSEFSKEELYTFFSKEKKARKWLEAKCLDRPLKLLYSSPLEYFHYSLPVRERDDFLYNFGILNEKFEQALRNETNRRRHKAKESDVSKNEQSNQ